jgi:membrane protein DedA with SNARE-associated domain
MHQKAKIAAVLALLLIDFSVVLAIGYVEGTLTQNRSSADSGIVFSIGVAIWAVLNVALLVRLLLKRKRTRRA